TQDDAHLIAATLRSCSDLDIRANLPRDTASVTGRHRPCSAPLWGRADGCVPRPRWRHPLRYEEVPMKALPFSPRRLSSVVSSLALLLLLRVDAHAQWPAHGVFFDGPSVEDAPIAISDGVNGMILVWNTDPAESGLQGVYAARVDGAGATTWGP